MRRISTSTTGSRLSNTPDKDSFYTKYMFIIKGYLHQRQVCSIVYANVSSVKIKKYTCDNRKQKHRSRNWLSLEMLIKFKIF